ncbi:MAG: glycosyltransferase family A protein [Pseudomonadota bacterium]
MSIIMPAYNAGNFLTEAIDSVFTQTWENWELIIIDDGSTDDTPTILKGYVDPRLRVIQQVNAGVSAARNVGLDVAQGEFLMFLDADDRLPADAIANRAGFLDAHPEVDIVNGAVDVTSNGRLLRQYRPDLTAGLLLDRLARLEEGVFFSVNYMIRREKVGNHRFPEGLSHCEDLIFFLSLAHDKNLCYGAVDDIIYEYRIQPGSAMSNLDGLERGYLALLECASSLSRVNSDMYRFLERRVSAIMVKSWLRRGRVDRALSVLRRIGKASSTPAVS